MIAMSPATWTPAIVTAEDARALRAEEREARHPVPNPASYPPRLAIVPDTAPAPHRAPFYITPTQTRTQRAKRALRATCQALAFGTVTALALIGLHASIWIIAALHATR